MDEPCSKIGHVAITEHFNRRLDDMDKRWDMGLRNLALRLDERYDTQTRAMEAAKVGLDAKLLEMNNLRYQIEGERRGYVTKGEFTIFGVVTVVAGVVISIIGWVR